MAIVLIDGFDTYNGLGVNTGLASKYVVGGSNGPIITTGRFGGQCFGSNSGNLHEIQRSIPTPVSSFSWGCAAKFNVGWQGTYIVSFASGATHQVGLSVGSTGGLQASRMSARNTAGAVLGSSAAGVIQFGTWHYIEIECVISDTVGVLKVYVDGVIVPGLNLTNVDTRNGTPTTVNTINLGNPSNGVGAPSFYDDMYWTDTATRLGERRVETLYPNADVANGWARSAGSTNFSLVDEPQVNGDTDYVQASAVNDLDLYDLANLSQTPTAISAVQPVAYGLKTDLGVRQIALQLKSGATSQDGANHILATAYTKAERIVETDPNTGIAWTAAAVNALQGGPKVTV